MHKYVILTSMPEHSLCCSNKCGANLCSLSIMNSMIIRSRKRVAKGKRKSRFHWVRFCDIRDDAKLLHSNRYLGDIRRILDIRGHMGHIGISIEQPCLLLSDRDDHQAVLCRGSVNRRFRNIHFLHNFSSVFTIFSITVSFRSTIRDINFTNFS